MLERSPALLILIKGELVIDKKLKFSEHLDEVNKKYNQTLHFLHKLIKFRVCKKLKTILYN